MQYLGDLAIRNPSALPILTQMRLQGAFNRKARSIGLLHPPFEIAPNPFEFRCHVFKRGG